MQFCPKMYQLTTTSKRKKNLAVYTNSEGR